MSVKILETDILGEKDVCSRELLEDEISGKRSERYDDIFIYVPEMRQIIRIAEGNGSNLLTEDIESGYVDYIYYDQYELGVDMPVVDGGQILLEEMLRDRYRCMEGCIPDVLDMAYGDRMAGYMVL